MTNTIELSFSCREDALEFVLGVSGAKILPQNHPTSSTPEETRVTVDIYTPMHAQAMFTAARKLGGFVV